MDPHLNLLGPREQDHQRRVVEAELRRLVRELRGCGPMTRQQLADLCGAAHWREGSFEAAVRRGIDEGRLRQLGFDFLAAGRTSPDQPRRA